MCLINFQLGKHSKYKLIIAANRDEEYERPTEPAGFWRDDQHVLAGRDLRGMGTWLGITKNGRIAALTNIRNQDEILKTNMRTRGQLVSGFLTSHLDARSYLKEVQKDIDEYSGFNLIAGSSDTLLYLNNYDKEIVQIENGIHGLSNHLLDTPWPKVEKGKERLGEITRREEVDIESLFAMLRDEKLAERNQLPDTGLSQDLEKNLSPMFINMDKDDTRCSTVVTIYKENNVQVIERTYQQGKFIGEENYHFTIN